MNICVYGAASNEIDNSYITAVEELGEEMGKRGHTLIYGGGAQGLMGAAARGVKKGGGKVIGVAPSFFKVDGVLFKDCDEFIFTDTMRERKQIMEDKADAFITTPGGIGTFEEFFEILTLKQLRRHGKALAVYNLNGYYDNADKMINDAIEKKFMKPTCKILYELFTDKEKMLDYIENYKQLESKPCEFKNV